MKIFIYFLFLSEVVKNAEFLMVGSSANNKKTFLIKNKTNDIFLKRSKRYLLFEKGSSLIVQTNIAKSVIPPAPRGLNVITEYTLNYELPSDVHAFERKHLKTTKKPTATSTARNQHNHMIVPYSHDYFHHLHPEYMIERRRYSDSEKIKCFKRKFYDHEHNRRPTNVCLSRAKRNEDWSLSKLSISQRMFYDLIEKWSLIHGYLPRYCFMRTLCESSALLLPYGYSLLHDIIHILLGYTKPWAIHHKIFGRSLRQWKSIDECAKMYGLYCRVSWLTFITNVVAEQGSRVVGDFMS